MTPRSIVLSALAAAALAALAGTASAQNPDFNVEVFNAWADEALLEVDATECSKEGGIDAGKPWCGIVEHWIRQLTDERAAYLANEAAHGSATELMGHVNFFLGREDS